MIQFQPLIACICEGGTEATIVDILLENDCLCFKRENMLFEDIIRERNAKRFSEKYLRMDFKTKISIIRILDSKGEHFEINKAYLHKIDSIKTIITAPEIEMLIILKEHKYKEYKKSGKKPSEYCKQDLKMNKVKSPVFIREYFQNIADLIFSIKEYKRISKKQKGIFTLADLLSE